MLPCVLDVFFSWRMEAVILGAPASRAGRGVTNDNSDLGADLANGRKPGVVYAVIPALWKWRVNLLEKAFLMPSKAAVKTC